MEIVKERCKIILDKIRYRKHSHQPFDVSGVKRDITGLIDFLEVTTKEVVEPRANISRNR